MRKYSESMDGWDIMVRMMFRNSIFDAFWSPLGSLLAPLGLQVAHFGFTFGSLLVPFVSLLAPFGSLWLTFGTLFEEIIFIYFCCPSLVR